MRLLPKGYKSKAYPSQVEVPLQVDRGEHMQDKREACQKNGEVPQAPGRTYFQIF